MFFVVNKYAYSVKEQQIAAKKIYSIDTGLTQAVGFSFSQNQGKLMENVVFLQLRRKYQDIYYYKTAQDCKVDFFVPQINQLIQVSQHFDTKEIQGRELRALSATNQEQKKNSSLIVVTETEKRLLIYNDLKVQIIPLYEWLLQ